MPLVQRRSSVQGSLDKGYSQYLKHQKKYKIMKLPFPGSNYINILRFRKSFNCECMRAFAVAALFTGMCQSAAAATLCVNPTGTSGCYSKIGAAVMKAYADFIL